MLDTTYPYMQASGNQVINMLETLVDAYTNVATVIGAMLLVLLICLCIAELRQPAKSSRAGGPLLKRSSARRLGERSLLEESSI